jgi:cytochrome c oxidase subunit 2
MKRFCDIAILLLFMTLPVEALATLNGVHNVLAPAGPQAAHIAELWYLTVMICSVVFIAILAAVIYSLWRAPHVHTDAQPDLNALTQDEPKTRHSVIVAVIASTVLLIVLVIASILTDRDLEHLSLVDALHIEVTGHQWWWEVRYDDKDVSKVFTTANEIHVPVGKPVILTLKANDVIHSFWVPNLTGKADLIPGRTANLRFRADQPGTYRGQCAEFCGHQHTFMAFQVIAHEQQDFESWRSAQQQPASEPQDARAVQGKRVFMQSPCAMCHAIQGTDAQAINGPDLTHIASRRALAAGTLKNTPENLAKWITNPQGIKPGTNMPPTALPQEDLQALVAYLERLK